jgi:hypothetical protein
VPPIFPVTQTASNTQIDFRKLLVYCSLTFLLLLIPLKISSYGNIPPDDAMRHAAFAVDNRTWGEVLVLRESILDSVDSHPGWHSLLRFLHQTLGFDTEGLVIASFVSAFFLFTTIGLYASGRPLVWMITLLTLYLVDGGVIIRVLLGRPFAISMAIALAILFIWQRENRLPKIIEYATTSFLLGFAIYLHPSWYLWLIFPPAFALCGRWEDAFRFGTCLLIAMLIATGLAQSYYNIVFYPLHHWLISMTQDPLRRVHLVGEFQPGTGVLLVVITVVITIVTLSLRGRDWRQLVSRPDFCIMVIGWVAGLYVTRFWSDWGSVGFIVWLCGMLSSLEFRSAPSEKLKVAVSVLICISLLLLIGSDTGGRYSHPLKDVLVTKPVEELRKALPDKGGILYGTDMRFFYQTYYRMPDAGFRYVIGFEPGMMTRENWDTLRKIQFNDGSKASYALWLKKMTYADRIEIPASYKPAIDGFEFESYAGRWIGKKVKQTPSMTPSQPKDMQDSKENPAAATGT